MKNTRIAQAVVALLCVGGCSAPTYLEDLKTPVLHWDRARGNCGSGFAVDAGGRLWVDPGGCEDGRPEFLSKGTCASAKIEALRAAFENLPKDEGPDRTVCGGNLDTFSRRSTDAFQSRSCASGTGPDLAGLQEPYLSVANDFLSLP
jgi:hypothetical protein